MCCEPFLRCERRLAAGRRALSCSRVSRQTAAVLLVHAAVLYEVHCCGCCGGHRPARAARRSSGIDAARVHACVRWIVQQGGPVTSHAYACRACKRALW